MKTAPAGQSFGGQDLGSGAFFRAIVSLVLVLNVLAGAVARQLAQHRAGHQARAAGVVVIEQPADQLARGEQAGDDVAVGALDLALGG